jgi:hypothetical protein
VNPIELDPHSKEDLLGQGALTGAACDWLAVDARPHPNNLATSLAEMNVLLALYESAARRWRCRSRRRRTCCRGCGRRWPADEGFPDSRSGGADQKSPPYPLIPDMTIDSVK